MRERDIRNAAHDLLVATGQYDNVWHGAVDDPNGIAASALTGVAISPHSTAESLVHGHGGFDAAPGGGIVYLCRVNLEVVARDEDPQVRDELAERLLNVARDALNGQSLAGMTFAQHTKVLPWTWQKPAPPERQILAVLECQYEEDGWAVADVSE